jgi:hypothetical protein
LTLPNAVERIWIPDIVVIESALKLVLFPTNRRWAEIADIQGDIWNKFSH